MHAALLVLTLALPPTNETRRVEVDVEADFSAGTLALETAPPYASLPGSTLSGTGAAGITVYARPLRDDDAPPSLQAFLQRATTFHLGGNGNGGALTPPTQQLEPSAETMTTHRTLSGGYVDAWAEGYARWLFWQLSLAVDYGTWSDTFNYGSAGVITTTTNELLLPVVASLGVRVRELLFWASWTVSPYRLVEEPGSGSFTVSNWSHASVGFDGAFARRFYVTGSVQANDSGAVGSASLALYIKRRIDVWAGVSGGHGAIYSDSENVYDTAGGSVGVGVWLTPHERISLGYAPTWTRASVLAQQADGTSIRTGQDDVVHTLSVVLLERR